MGEMGLWENRVNLLWTLSWLACAKYASLPSPPPPIPTFSVICFLETANVRGEDSWPGQTCCCCTACCVRIEGSLDRTPPLPRFLDALLPGCIQSAVNQGDVGVVASICHPTREEECRAREVSVSGVEGAGIDRAEAARAWDSLALVTRGLYASPLGWLPLLACLWHWITALVLMVPPCYATLI